ncbi:MAG TPA: hypothetical protein VK760_07245, partial [Candidatus Acidoferrales bacterium]|nr:hypothetical protein [Candidatus Acidoferrales bacterium]
EDVVNRYNAGTLWPLLAAKHVNVVLAGFDDAYIKKCSSEKGAAAMNAIVAEAARHGVRVELLLGDPSWIPPSGVPSLNRILHALRRVNFARLDLDLEPNELKGVSTVTAFKDLVTSMHAYIASSSWPVSMDVNHIYVDGAAVKKYRYCLMCSLERAGLKRANLMTYVSDPKTVVADVAPILARYPGVAFTISQSVEPPSVLPVWDSYWDDGFAAFYADMQQLDAALAPHGNYAGITIESLYYLERIKP